MATIQLEYRTPIKYAFSVWKSTKPSDYQTTRSNNHPHPQTGPRRCTHHRHTHLSLHAPRQPLLPLEKFDPKLPDVGPEEEEVEEEVEKEQEEA